MDFFSYFFFLLLILMELNFFSCKQICVPIRLCVAFFSTRIVQLNNLWRFVRNKFRWHAQDAMCCVHAVCRAALDLMVLEMKMLIFSFRHIFENWNVFWYPAFINLVIIEHYAMSFHSFWSMITEHVVCSPINNNEKKVGSTTFLNWTDCIAIIPH